jgi:methylated-DNA-protein-cysteine methyltransferase-like protein
MADRATYDHIVWGIVWQIPPGRVITYGQIASMIPMPDGMELPSYERIAPRWVGYAMRRCMSDNLNNPGDPTQPSIPWQRVLNSQGRSSLRGYEGDQQRTRLEDEGVEFDRSGRVDFEVFGWAGPDDDWLREHNLKRPQTLTR